MAKRDYDREIQTIHKRGIIIQLLMAITTAIIIGFILWPSPARSHIPIYAVVGVIVTLGMITYDVIGYIKVTRRINARP